MRAIHKIILGLGLAAALSVALAAGGQMSAVHAVAQDIQKPGHLVLAEVYIQKPGH